MTMAMFRRDGESIKACRKPRGVAFNAKNKELYVVDMNMNAMMTYSIPEMFEPQKK